METVILNLIKKYQVCAKYVCDSLASYYNIGDIPLLKAYREDKIIPKNGTLPDGTFFNFHGSGCFFKFKEGEIDVDFGPEGRCDGFDLFRLQHFNEQLTGSRKINITKLRTNFKSW
jgi:hypothetical protein